MAFSMDADSTDARTAKWNVKKENIYNYMKVKLQAFENSAAAHLVGDV